VYTYNVQVSADNDYGPPAWHDADVVVRADVNDSPEAADDSATVNEGATTTVLDGGQMTVLHNDTDRDPEDNLTVDTTPVSGPDHGSLTLNGSGTFSYTHDGSETTGDSFVYQVCDDGAPQACDTATVSVTVVPVNDAPLANDDDGETDEDAPVVIDVLSNDNDAEDDPLSVEEVGAPAHGQVSTDGITVTYTPDLNFNGSDTFTYTVGDGNGGSDTASVNVLVHPVNDDPVAVHDQVATDEDTALLIYVLLNDDDVDGDLITLDSVSQPDNGVTGHSTDTVVYTPTLDWSGWDTFTYTISDGNGGSATAVVSVTVNPVNDAPLAADVPDQTVDEGGTFAVIDLDDYVADVDDADAEMTWSFAGNAALQVSIVDRVASVGIPDVDWNGSETIVFTATDSGGLSASDAATFTVNAVNDAPDAVDDAATTHDDTAVTIAVLDNDTDPDLDSLSVVMVGAPITGSASIAGTAVVYTPTLGLGYLDAFTYTISDGNGGSDTATVTVVVEIRGPDTFWIYLPLVFKDW
jgi:VCBS repeat-containing protein